MEKSGILIIYLYVNGLEHCTGIAEVRVRIPVQSFFAAAKAALICDDQIHSLLTTLSSI